MYNSVVNSKPNHPFSSWMEKPFFQIYISLILILFSWTAINIIRFPYGMDYGEAPLMDQVKRIENQETIYKANINQPPYFVANYPPLYVLTVAVVNSLFKTPLFLTGRVISVFFSLVSGVIIGLFGFHLTHNKLLGVLAAVLFLGNPYVMIWSSLARVDIMALALTLIGLWILFWSKDTPAWIIGASLFIIASIFTRQTYLLSGPLAGFIWQWHQNRRRALLFIMLIGVLSLTLFGMINAITDGGFYTNIVVANINTYDFSRMLLMFRQLFTFWPVILIGSVGIIFVVFRSWIKGKDNLNQEKDYSAFMVYGLVPYTLAAFISALTIGKVGSDVNYFLELISACAIWCVIALKTLLDRQKVIKWSFIGLFSIQLIWILLAGYILNRSTIGPRWDALMFYDDLYSKVHQASQKGVVLSDDYLDMVVLAGQHIYYQPFEYGQLYYAGLWNPSQFAAEISNQSFPLVLIGGDTLNKDCCWPPPLVTAFNVNYQIDATNNVLILTPNK